MRIEKEFCGPYRERYHFDTNEFTTENGFAQVNTPEDAPYYGMWTNPFMMTIATFIEGDMSYCFAESAEEYCLILRGIEERHNHEMFIDTMHNNELTQRFIELHMGCILK